AALAAPASTWGNASAPAANAGARSVAPETFGPDASGARPLHSSAPPQPFGPSSSGRVQILKPHPPSLPPSANHLRANRVEADGRGERRWAELEPLGDWRPAQRERLLRGAVVTSLAREEESKIGGLALVLEGQATIQPTVSDVPVATLKAKDFIFGQP